MKIIKPVWCQSLLSRTLNGLMCLCCLFAPTIVSAADGDVDPTFKTDVTENGGTIEAVAVQPDNKILVGGFFEAFGGRARRGVARLNADGTLDLTFDAGAAIPNARAAQATVKAIIVQPDGKILVGISYFSPGPTPRKLIVRLHTDGTLDLSFNTNLLTRPFGQDGAFAIALQADGKILVGGDFRYNNGTQRDFARLNSDGSIDTSFIQPTGGIGAKNVRAVAIQSDGKSIVGGLEFSHSTAAGSRQAIWRLNSDGNPDTTYSVSNNPSSGNITALVLQPNGSVVAVGGATISGQSFLIARFDTNGIRDPGFTDIFQFGAPFNLIRQTDGKLIVVGNFQITNPATRSNIARLNVDGSLDTSFNTSGSTGTVRSISAAALQPDGKVIPVGRFDNFNGSPAEDYLRLNADGSRDASFVSNSQGYYGRVYAFLRQPDGKILAAISSDGNETKVNGVRTNGIVRFNKDYSVDTTFVSPLSVSSIVLNLALQADGKILVSGFLRFNNSTFSLLRLNPNGAVDAAFNPPPDLKIPVVQTDGRIIAVGMSEIVRLNSNGSRDNTFTVNLGSGSFIAALALQTDGRILVGGSFLAINGVSRNNVARLNTDGSVDANFNPGTGANDAVRTFLTRADGRIYIGGRFTSFNGTARNGLALLESNGGLNASFVPANPGNMDVYAIASQPDGKLIYGGEQLPAGSIGVYRLGADGSLDASFALGAASNRIPNVFAILLQANGKIVVGGRFESYNDTPRMSLVRLNPRNNAADFDGDGRTDVSVFRPSNGAWYAMRSTAGFTGVQWGVSSDKLTPADFDGDGKTDIAVWRSSSLAHFYILNSSDNTVRTEQFGQTSDFPAVGDWDGDGRADAAVYRGGSQSHFFYRGSLNNSQGNISSIPWGTSGDHAVRGDFDGDERLDAAIFRPSSGVWHIHRSSDGASVSFNWGLNTDAPTPADFDGDGKTDVAVFRNGVWFVLRSLSGTPQSFHWGLSSDALVPADYDGDGRADFAIFRNGLWCVYQTASNQIRYDNFGASNDIPVPLIQ